MTPRNPVKEIVRLTDVSYSYEESVEAEKGAEDADEASTETWALKGVSLGIKQGKSLAIVGANGSGKSTLARLIAGLEAPDRGTVELFSETCFENDAPHAEAYACARKKIAMVFQEPEDQIVGMTVTDDIVFGPENLGFSREEIEAVLADSLERFGLLELRDANPMTLSGGQQQKLVLASALAMRPQLLILDEAASHLDAATRKTLFQSLSDFSLTTVFITHSVEEALSAERVLVLNAGKVAALGTPSEVFDDPKKMRELGLGLPFAQQLELALEKRGLEVSHTPYEDELIASLEKKFVMRTETFANADDAREGDGNAKAEPAVNTKAEPAANATEEPAAYRKQEDASQKSVSIKDLSFSYKNDEKNASVIGSKETPKNVGEKEVLRSVFLSVEPATTCALIGETGAGKPTLFKAIAGLFPNFDGEILVEDETPLYETRFLHYKKRKKNWSAKVGYVMQAPERQLFAETVLQDVQYGPLNLGLSEGEAASRARETLRDLGIEHLSEASPFGLSTGQARLVAIAGIIAMGPDVLAFDEPFAGLDFAAAKRLRNILLKLAAKGKTILFTTHDMNEAAVAGQVALLAKNTIQLAAPPKDFFAQEKLLSRFNIELPWTMQVAEKIFGKEHPYPADVGELADDLVNSGTHQTNQTHEA